MTPLDRRLQQSKLAFGAAFLLLGLLGGWWSVLIGKLVNENYALQVAVLGASPEVAEAHARRSLMLYGESSLLLLLNLALVVLAWQGARREQLYIRRVEGLLAASTHELKTPIAGLRSLLESMASGVIPADRAAVYAERGLQACTRLEHLVEGILAWQAAQARRGVAEERPLRVWVEEVLAHRLESERGEGLDVDLGEAGEAPVVMVPDAFRVILENLLDNARKYGGEGPVRVRGRRLGAQVLLEVTDDGAGFAPETAEALFEPYQRGGGGQRRHGTGLGLHIARSLARSQGGELTASSPGPGRGATFTLRVR